MPRLTRPAFRDFLASKKPTYAFIEKHEWADSCPLACFTGKPQHGTGHYDMDTGKEVRNPKWVTEFIDAVDTDCHERNTGKGWRITARRALSILDSLK